MNIFTKRISINEPIGSINYELIFYFNDTKTSLKLEDVVINNGIEIQQLFHHIPDYSKLQNLFDFMDIPPRISDGELTNLAKTILKYLAFTRMEITLDGQSRENFINNSNFSIFFTNTDEKVIVYNLDIANKCCIKNIETFELVFRFFNIDEVFKQYPVVRHCGTFNMLFFNSCNLSEKAMIKVSSWNNVNFYSYISIINETVMLQIENIVNAYIRRRNIVAVIICHFYLLLDYISDDHKLIKLKINHNNTIILNNLTGLVISVESISNEHKFQLGIVGDIEFDTNNWISRIEKLIYL